MEDSNHHLKKYIRLYQQKKHHMAVFFKGNFFPLKTAMFFLQVWGAVPWSTQLRWKTTMHAHNLIFNNLNVFGKVLCDLCFPVGGWTNQPIWKIFLLVKLDSISPKVRDEHKTYLSCHQLVLSIFKTNEHEYFMVFVSNEITTQRKWMNLEMSWGFSLKKSSMNLWFL